MILIKKEKDNRLYDSSLKKYITLREILKYIQKDQHIKVIDGENKDITREVLFAAIYFQRHSLKTSVFDLIQFIKQGLL